MHGQYWVQSTGRTSKLINNVEDTVEAFGLNVVAPEAGQKAFELFEVRNKG